MSGKGRRTGHHDDGDFYEHWRGERTRMADVITGSEVDLLEEVIAPLQEDYHGPALGTRHEYPPTRTPKVSGQEPPDWLIEHRRLERLAWWAQREANHARAMALDQAERERRRFHAAPEDVQPRFLPRKRATFRLTVYCPCGNRGDVILCELPKAGFRCSQCGELQKL